MSFRRMVPFIFINIVVSATVVLVILLWWDGRQAQGEEGVQETAVAAATLIATEAAIPLPQATNTPGLVEGPMIHIVQAGENLGRISQFYSVPIDDIMTVNGITNPDILDVGQELIIPVGGIPTATPAPTATPIPTEPLPEVTQPAEETGTVVLQITEVVGVGQLAEETVQIVNSGSGQVALLNWQLRDQDGHAYTFGLFTLYGDGAGVMVHTEAGQNDSTNLYWGLEEPIWQSGELVTLLDAAGAVQASFTIP